MEELFSKTDAYDNNFVTEVSKIHRKYVDKLLPYLQVGFDENSVRKLEDKMMRKTKKNIVKYTEEEIRQNKEALEKIRDSNPYVKTLIDAFELEPF